MSDSKTAVVKEEATVRPVDREGLARFLMEKRSEGVTPDEIAAAMANLEGLFVQAERERFLLIRVEDLDVLVAAKVVDTAIGVRNVVKLTGFSVSGAAGQDIEILFPTCLGENIRDRFEQVVRDSFGDAVDGFNAVLVKALQTSLLESLEKSLKVSLGGTFGNRLFECIWFSIRMTLFMYLGLVLAGKRAEADELAPLVRLSSTAPSLCWLKDQPDILAILTA
ncbi:MAG: hypothetical protein ABIJ46_02525 [bacterium]